MRALLPLLIALPLLADWPQFRGPDGSGLCPSCGRLPTEFGPEKNVVWKTALPPGKSSPVLVGDRIFLTGAQDNELITLAVSRLTGEILWRRSIRATRRDPRNALNHAAAPTAVSDGKRVFVFFADFGLAAYGLDGKPLWEFPLDGFNSQHGVSGSPVYADGKVVLVCDTDTDAFILAVDADRGTLAWKKSRHVINGYATPVVYHPPGGPAQIIAAGSYQLTSYSVLDGEVVWLVQGLTCQPKSAPILSGGNVYFNGWTTGNDAGEQVNLPPFPEVIATADANRDGKLAQKELPPPWQPTGSWRAIDLDRDGFLNEREWTFFRTRRAARNGLLAIKLGGQGDVTSTHVLWRHEKSLPDVPSPLIDNGVVYLIRSGGIATTLKAGTGEVIKQGRLTGALEDIYSSPVSADGKLFVATEHGKVVVLRAAGDWEVLAVNDFGSNIYATPAISHDRMYIRTQDALYAIGFALSAQVAAGSKVVLHAAAGRELATYGVDVRGAALEKRASVTLPDNVQEAWPHPSRRYLYVAWSNNAAGSTGHHGVTAFQVDPVSGVLRQHGEPVTVPARSVFLTTDISGKHIVTAYNQPSSATVHRINPDGTIGAAVPQPAGLDFGVYAHQVRVDPSNSMAIIVARGNVPAATKPEDPGSIQVFGYRDGVLSNRARIAPGGGRNYQPRHLDFHPSRPFAFVTIEAQNKLHVYRIAGGPSLSAAPLFSRETLTDPSRSASQATSAIHTHPNGRFVYLGNRGTSAGGENSIAVYSINQESGEPTLIQNADTHGIHPRTFTLDPDGQLLVVANLQRSGGTPASLAVFRIGTDGKLTFARKYDQDASQGNLFWTGMMALPAR
ncbi:MAG: hypothetical protein FJW39_10730 [Acidobacteria bacterium]|nr:hypothetical protein [Acidobacteriota bacterium]